MNYPEDYVNKVICGDCLEVLRQMPDESVDSIVTDPPYGISFMGKHWDYGVPKVEVWAECLRVLKPGGHILVACGTRTQHRMAVNIEDAGFEIRDLVAWLYGSGFPKSLNIGKQDGCEHMNGWGTALKPAMELWTLARKPLIGTVAENVLKYGTGGINVDGCRVEHNEPIVQMKAQIHGDLVYGQSGRHEPTTELKENGRFPANLIHDGSEEVLAGFPNSGNGNGNGSYNYAGRVYDNKDTSMFNGDKPQAPSNFNDSGSAARFFYCAKASKEDRDEGCYELDKKQAGTYGEFAGDGRGRQTEHAPLRNNHPTVKPTDLMRYLCRLVTPPNGLILDPFFGSGSTGRAAKLEYFNYIGIEREPEYCEIATKRISATIVNKKLNFQ